MVIFKVQIDKLETLHQEEIINNKNKLLKEIISQE